MRGSLLLVIATLFAAVAFALCAPPAKAGGEHTALACSLCDGLSAHMSGKPGEPFFFRSFEPAKGGSKLPPALDNSAFTYDNALALMALLGCGHRTEAKRVADAFMLALAKDRTYRDGRLRNAYRSGPVVLADDGIMLPGYWNAATSSWDEDDYQVGSATGSTAWGALALLAAYAETAEPAYLDGARTIMDFIHDATIDSNNPGFLGGYFGHEPAPVRVTWKSTEHNLDVYAADSWLAGIDKAGAWDKRADSANAFLNAMWNEGESYFWIGSVPGSNGPNTSSSGLDAQLWPLLAMPEFRARAPQILAWTEANHGVPGGFDFNTDRDGIWLEGTAQAALAYLWIGEPQKAEPLFATIEAQVSPDRLVYATSGAQLTTGLEIGPTADGIDFKYYRLPHVGATGWAVLAALGMNPFTPDSFPQKAPRNACAPQ